jgi:hypothetical protein
MKNLNTILLIAAVLGLGACAGHRAKDFNGLSSAEAPGVLTVRTGWLKNKRKAFDTEIWLINNYKSGIVIPVARLGCAHGPAAGSIRLISYKAGTIELEPGEQKRFVANCETYSKAEGDYIIRINDIAVREANGAGGKVLAKEVVLTLNPVK